MAKKKPQSNDEPVNLGVWRNAYNDGDVTTDKGRVAGIIRLVIDAVRRQNKPFDQMVAREQNEFVRWVEERSETLYEEIREAEAAWMWPRVPVDLDKVTIDKETKIALSAKMPHVDQIHALAEHRSRFGTSAVLTLISTSGLHEVFTHAELVQMGLVRDDQGQLPLDEAPREEEVEEETPARTEGVLEQEGERPMSDEEYAALPEPDRHWMGGDDSGGGAAQRVTRRITDEDELARESAAHRAANRHDGDGGVTVE